MGGNELDLRNLLMNRKQEMLDKCMQEVQEVLNRYNCFLDVDVRIAMNADNGVSGEST